MGLLLLASPVYATTHPRLLSTRAQWAGMISSSTVRPWSDLKAGATNFYASAKGVTVRSKATYAADFLSHNSSVWQQHENKYSAALGNLTLLYVLNTNNASSHTYRTQITDLMDIWPQIVVAELATTGAPTPGYNEAVPMNSAFMSMTLAFDNIYDDLSPTVQSSYTAMMDSWLVYSRTQPSSWALNNYGAYKTYDLFRDTSPFQIAADSTCYHANLTGNNVIYPPAVCGSRQAYPELSSEISGAQLNSQGISGSGSSYAWARLGGGSREKMGKWGGVHVAAFTGTDNSYVTDIKMRNFYEWLFAAHTTPWNTKVPFADTSNNQNIGEDEYMGLSTIYPGALYIVPNAYFAAGKYSPLAQQFANRSLAVSTVTLVYPFEFIDYAVISSTDVTSHPVQSKVVQYGGAAFWDEDQSTGALQGILNNGHLTKIDHYHMSDFNGLFLAGYGETLLSNPGVASGTSDGILDFSWWWHHEDAHAGNTVMIQNRNFANDNNTGGLHYSNSYWNWNPGTPFVGNGDATPLYGGDGITDSVLGVGFDYASGIATSPYVFRSTTTGTITETLGQNERNFFFVHPDTTSLINGYWFVSDEARSTAGGAVNVAWHPYGSSFSTTTTSQEYAWPISDRAGASSTKLHIFLATPPTTVVNSSSPFSATPASFVGAYINVAYNVDASSNVRAVTLLYPTNPTHSKSTFTRLSTGDATGASVLSGSTTDYILASSGTTNITSGGATFRGKLGFFRRRGGTVTQYFVRKGISFDDGGGVRRGFSSLAPVSVHVAGSSATITSTGTTVSFYGPDIGGVQVDGISAAGTKGSNVFTLALSSGSHALLLTDSHITGYWASGGEIKVAREDHYPQGTCSTCAITRNWDGTTAQTFTGKNETVGLGLYLLNASAGDATGVSVAVSSLTCDGGTGIASVAVSSGYIWDTTTRPIEVFKMEYVPIRGESQLAWDSSEYEARDLPPRFRRPYTVNGSNQGVASGGWDDRPDANKFLPEIATPMELFPSGFTVARSSSQLIWIDIYTGPGVAAGTCSGSINVTEGSGALTSIPLSLLVYNFTLPDAPTLKTIGFISGSNVNHKMQNDFFPPAGDPYETSRNRAAQMLHRHKFAASIGDSGNDYCGNGNVPQPCPEYVERLDGSLYTSGQGYGNAPGAGVGDSIYAIGTYGEWHSAQWSSSTVGGVGGFCTNVSSWGAYFRDNFPNVLSFVYLSDEVADFTATEKWATWMSTVAACRTTGYTPRSFATGSYPDVAAGAPHLQIPAATYFYDASSTTWQGLADAYQTSGTTQAWVYNGHPSHSGGIYSTEDSGISAMVSFWMDWKKNIPVHFLWETTDWNIAGQGFPEENDLWHDAKTFGYDSYPSTSTTKGRFGFNYSNGDGVLMYPGTDVVTASPNYGVNATIASLRLKLVRRGIQDADYLEMAYAVNPNATMAIVNALVPQALWDHGSFDPLDPTYAYGGRTWSEDPQAWETARESLAQIIDAGATPSSFRGQCVLKGQVNFK